MAAGFTMKKFNIKLLDDFIQNDYLKNNSNRETLNEYDFKLSPSAIKITLINDINKLKPFGNYNFLPIFLINNLKVIKHNIIKNKHLSVILKPESGGSIKGICFNCLNTDLGNYLLNL
jgi:single-stranded-DNA-specific exonuclease